MLTNKPFKTPQDIIAAFHKEGEQAYLDGLKLEDCPYKPTDTLKVARWRRGYMNAMQGDLIAKNIYQ